MSSFDSSGDEDQRDSISIISRRSFGAKTIHACPYNDCAKFFARPSRLATHILSHTNEKPFICEAEGCGKAYGRKTHLNRHFEKTHTNVPVNETRVKCSECSADFANKYALKKHWKKHHEQNDVEFNCDECDQKFSCKPLLIDHQKTSHPEVRLKHACKQCSKRFRWPKQLREHEKKHLGYSCPVCQSVFPKWSELNKHKAAEHGKTYQCSVCEKFFEKKTNLDAHLETHKEEKSIFKCTEPNCTRWYLHERNLNAHVKSFHQENRLTCMVEGCDAKFTFKAARKRHMKNVHRNQPKPLKVKNNAKRKPRKDKGQPKTAMAAELSGVKIDPKTKREIMCNSGKIALSPEAIAEEVESIEDDFNLPCGEEEESSFLENENEIKEENDPEGKSFVIPDVFFPMKRIFQTKCDESDDPVQNEEDSSEEQSDMPQENYDFSVFLDKNE